MPLPDVVEIRKYPNKKYYVSGWGIYLSLRQIAGLVCSGRQIRVRLHRKGEDHEDVTAEAIAKALALCFEQLSPPAKKQEVGCQWMIDTLRHCFTYEEEELKGKTVPTVAAEQTEGKNGK